MNDVMETLKDDRFHVIGICGMWGVGKTTMVKQVAKRVTEKNLFDGVVIAVVSQSPNEMKIQGLRHPKKIFVILDDVWNRLKLNDIGIPFGDGHKNCKILLTSRFDYVCDDMGAETKFTIPALSTNEAWKLFKDMARISNDTSHTSTDLYFTQKADATECGGLSVAIVIVAWALKDKDRHSWNSALQQLSKSLVKNIRRVEEKVFKSLELSDNYLESTNAKKCFLLYSLYLEDFNIPIEYLVRYGFGIELFEAVDSVSETRDRVHAFIDELKKGYLLMDSEVKSYVKMHDVIRDVAISIASKEEHSFMLDKCEDLGYLIKTTNGDGVQLQEEAFTALKEMQLLDLPALTHLWKGPTQLVQLRNLTSVEVKRCDKLKSMFLVSIARDLRQLQTLKISRCRMMEVLISSDKERDQNEIASATTHKIVFPKLRELILGRLPSFTVICKAINAIKLPQLNQLILCKIPKLNSFCNSLESNYNTIQPPFNKVELIAIEKLLILSMHNVMEIWLGKHLQKLRDMIIFRLLVKLQEINVTECGVLEAIIGEEPKVDDKVIANIIMFPQLSSLKLYHLSNLRSICPQAYAVEGSFLKKVEVINCPNMKALPSAFQGIPELQESNVQKVDFFGSAQHHL
ncbi:hypothetical protein ACSBR1_035024 [Camellia fascicularis]